MGLGRVWLWILMIDDVLGDEVGFILCLNLRSLGIG